MKSLYDKVSFKTSMYTTNTYSTSFSMGIRFLHMRFHQAIYGIYGFVRLGDEIVDTFHDYNKKALLERFRRDVDEAIEEKISLNPILNSFQHVVHKYNIEKELIDLFINSMEMDLDKQAYDQSGYKRYILGSAEVVGLMCLRVFCAGDDALYNNLKPFAMSLGSAYQKINFLRDLKADYQHLGRTYFPNVDLNEFNENHKKQIEQDIENDFRNGLKGIKKLPQEAKFGVYLSYIYFYGLFRKIKKTPSREILKRRIRISNRRKYYLLARSIMVYKLRLL
ncbi:MAG: squalene/phytoene synthase family protein [Bacteroidetes bacterium]|nr:squalene/phytoene synthase family protein [Bacteroidota bacterium]